MLRHGGTRLSASYLGPKDDWHIGHGQDERSAWVSCPAHMGIGKGEIDAGLYEGHVAGLTDSGSLSHDD